MEQNLIKYIKFDLFGLMFGLVFLVLMYLSGLFDGVLYPLSEILALLAIIASVASVVFVVLKYVNAYKLSFK